MNDDEYREFQLALMSSPTSGSVIQGTGGLRKVRVSDSRRQKGKRGGIRVIYYWYPTGKQFWLFTIFDKDEMTDLTTKHKNLLRSMLKEEVRAYGKT